MLYNGIIGRIDNCTQAVMQLHMRCHEGVTVYGHVGADLITLVSMLRIPVTMHNGPADKVYRPHSWAAFGTQDTQAADYAACKHYGPLYGKL